MTHSCQTCRALMILLLGVGVGAGAGVGGAPLRAAPKSLFVQATSVPTGADEYRTRTWFHKVCTDHRTPGSPDFIHNLVLSEIADPQGNLATAALDIIEDYYGCFDNVFIGTANLPHADPYNSGMKDVTFRWDNINLSAQVAAAYDARFGQSFPGQAFHWYISYEANLNYLASDVTLKNAYAAYLLELTNQLTAIRSGAVLWSPAFWTPYGSVPSYSALQSALTDVLSTAPLLSWLHFQDFVGQAASLNCSTSNITYGFGAADGIGYHGLVSAANPGTLASVRVNMEHFVLGDAGTCGAWYIVAGDPVEHAAREAAYEAAGVPIGASWEIRWWYLAQYGPETQACNQPELCDGADNDCDLQVDEGLGPRACDVTNQHGTCTGTETCGGSQGWIGCTALTPAAEACDGVDNNCDGQVDEGCTCTDGDSRPCGSDVGSCELGTQLCGGGVWGSCEGGVTPELEVCGDGVDNDCDGLVDQDCDCASGDTRSCGSSDVGACELGVQTCVNDLWGLCVGAVEPSDEVCGDGVDNDCDGETDQGCAPDPDPGPVGSGCSCRQDQRPGPPLFWLLLALLGIARGRRRNAPRRR
ncbi:MAG: MopE-related protein [bacterium]